MRLDEIIKRPVITEKSLEAVKGSQYTFVVNSQANKTDIQRAVTDIFGVEVRSVSVINRAAKMKRRARGGLVEKQPRQKRAIVTINSKQKIDLFDQVEKTQESERKKD